MTERVYRDIAPLSPEGNTLSPGDTYRRESSHRSRIRERLAVVVLPDHTSWHVPNLREKLGWRSEAPFSPARAESSIAQALLDAGYRVRVEGLSNATMVYIAASVKPKRLF